MNRDGSDQTQLTRLPASSATWSPDGRKIAFHASASGAGLPIRSDPGAATSDSDIFVLNVHRLLDHGREHGNSEDDCQGDDDDDTNPKNITNNEMTIDDDPDWSPDGKTITFTSHDVHGRVDDHNPLVSVTATGHAQPRPSSFDVALSRNGGSTFSGIAGCTNLRGALRSCTWTPSSTSSDARIRVTARDSGGASVTDMSDASFAIVAPAIEVVFPVGATSWLVGTTQTLQWHHNLGAASVVKIELSRNGGSSSQVLAASVQNSSATAGTFNWVVTGPPTNAAKLRVTWLAAPVSGSSSGRFSIVFPGDTRRDLAAQRGNPIRRIVSWNRGSVAMVLNGGYCASCANSIARS